MAHIVTFSQTFPGYHLKAGKPTGFVQSIWDSISEKFEGKHYNRVKYAYDFNTDLEHKIVSEFVEKTYGTKSRGLAKHHTIRKGKRFKVGDQIDPRVWSGKPYASKQIQFSPWIEVQKIWDFNMAGGKAFIGGYDIELDEGALVELAGNDGLTLNEFLEWFKDFSLNMECQIICWNESINY